MDTAPSPMAGLWQGNGMVCVNRALCGHVMSGLSILQGKWYQTDQWNILQKHIILFPYIFKCVPNFILVEIVSLVT
jgi:hypothetical protein